MARRRGSSWNWGSWVEKTEGLDGVMEDEFMLKLKCLLGARILRGFRNGTITALFTLLNLPEPLVGRLHLVRLWIRWGHFAVLSKLVLVFPRSRPPPPHSSWTKSDQTIPPFSSLVYDHNFRLGTSAKWHCTKLPPAHHTTTTTILRDDCGGGATLIIILPTKFPLFLFLGSSQQALWCQLLLL